MENKSNFLIQLDDTQYQTPDITKKGVARAATNIYTAVMDGNMSAVDVAVMLKFVEETGKSLKELSDDNGKNTFVDLVREEIERSADDGKTFNTKHGVKFELYEAATKFDYESCGDPIWNKLSKELELTKAKMKERESFLKSLKGATTMNIIDPDTSEFHENVELYPPAKSSTSTYKQTMING
jgi:hypothetical protein